ncbi:hypothetical protein CKM354_000289700 [Cercospora kikuchii]|uniref:Acyl-CoA dehydrogenase n=1 Tax=Cercospora kikuchii TaxID=84275 RepID=A0A9P3CD81_9PEZI|nr:uncharacterized protein CKM354_000289700 [Cercospora kikuchii]GIZ39516.1 hypothetical protein CKM354_000289700 [Cercospora kikuchii]
MNPVPFSEAPWLRMPSPFYEETHRVWQKFCREFIGANFTQYALQWENEGAVPAEVYRSFGKANMLAACLPAPLPAKLLRAHGITHIGPLAVEDFDYTHTSIFLSEMMSCGLSGPVSSLITGVAYGTPLLIDHAPQKIQSELIPEILKGNKRICIAITEPDAGSDVAGLQATAVKSADGKHYVINGAKKWITNGLWSDYASTCVRTGGKGPSGLSLLLVPLKNDGVSVRRIAVSGRKCSGTSYIEFDDVKVPVENLIGKEGNGMKYIMNNFNHERLSIAINTTNQARVALSSAFEYVTQREAFGAPLINQPVVRNRLARAGAKLETQWAWVESLVYQYKHLPAHEAASKLGGMTALVKANAGMVLNECAECAQILFGGNGYTQSGKGELVEKIAREVAGVRVPGGSEDIMLDLCIRQLYKGYTSQSTPSRL